MGLLGNHGEKTMGRKICSYKSNLNNKKTCFVWGMVVHTSNHARYSKFEVSLDYMKSCLRQTLSQHHKCLNHDWSQALGNGHPSPHPPLHLARFPEGEVFILPLPTPHQSLILKS